MDLEETDTRMPKVYGVCKVCKFVKDDTHDGVCQDCYEEGTDG